MQDAIQSILEQVGYERNPYFVNLKEGDFSKEDFIETQTQFFFAVIFFSRPMAALAAKIPTPELRLEILRNVWEEHGEGDADRVHGSTFVEFLNRIGGLKQEDIEARKLWPEVRIFNTTLTGACVLDEYMVGVGMMGIIERMFSSISNWIGRDVVDRGWLPAERMMHYNLHEEIDIKHSQDFFDVVSKPWNQSDVDRYYIEQGLLLGATVFNDLYRALYSNRARRWPREIRGPHSRAEG